MEKNSDSLKRENKILAQIFRPELISAYEKAKPRYPDVGSNEFIDYVLLNWRDLKKSNPSSEACHLYQRCNSEKKGRGSRFRKEPFFLSWLNIKIGGDSDLLLDVLDRVTDRADKQNRDFPRSIYDYSSDPASARSIYRYRKRRIIERKLLEIILDPEIEFRELQNMQLNSFEAAEERLNFSSILRTEFLLQEFMELKPGQDAEAFIKKELRSFDKLSGKILNLLKEKIAVSQRYLTRKFSLSISKLRPILDELKSEKMIKCENKMVSIAPRNSRKFIWLADSCFPYFGPKLEKGNSYEPGLFPIETISEWIKTGAAKYI